MNSPLDRFFDVLKKTIAVVCTLLLSAQVLLVAWVAFCRYVLERTPAWGENSALLCMVWFCLLSVALAVLDDTHLRMTLIDNFVSAKAVRALNLFSLFLIGAFGLFMLVEGIGLTKLTHRNIMTGLGVPSSILYSSVPVSGAAFFFAAIDKGRSLLWPRTQ
jgi:TRAP-type C4-dicarboxylate transport system permease small subunit